MSIKDTTGVVDCVILLDLEDKDLLRHAQDVLDVISNGSGVIRRARS